ncbi:MAG: hypothetical protein NC218_01710 [Acetobacter sp.]|nr:hypothetical protein [Acetobacter sp.]
MVKIKGNSESLAVKRECERIRTVFHDVLDNVNKKDFGAINTAELNWFKPHSFDYRKEGEYLAPQIIFTGVVIKPKAIISYLEEQGVVCFRKKLLQKENLKILVVSVAMRD